MALGQKEVRLSIKANTKKFQDELKKLPGVTDKEAKKMGRKFATQFDKAERKARSSSRKMQRHYTTSFGKMGSAAKNFQKVLAAGVFAAAAAGVFRLADSTSQYVDRVTLMEKQTGLASETLIGMEFASQAAGASMEQLQNGLNAFVMKAGMAANKGGASAEVFERMGVSVRNTSGEMRSMDDVFRDAITAISNMSTSQEKAATAAELFGARGAKIAAVFADGTGSLDAWSMKAKEAGVVMDQDTRKASEDMDRAMADLKLQMRATAIEAGKSLIPAMLAIMKAMAKLIAWIGKAASKWDSFTDSLFADLEGGERRESDYNKWEQALVGLKKAYAGLSDEAKKAAIETHKGSKASKVFRGTLAAWDSKTVYDPASMKGLQKAFDLVSERMQKGKNLGAAYGLLWSQVKTEVQEVSKLIGYDLTSGLKKGATYAKNLYVAPDTSGLEADIAAITKGGVTASGAVKKTADQIEDTRIAAELLIAQLTKDPKSVAYAEYAQKYSSAVKQFAGLPAEFAKIEELLEKELDQKWAEIDQKEIEAAQARADKLLEIEQEKNEEKLKLLEEQLAREEELRKSAIDAGLEMTNAALELGAVLAGENEKDAKQIARAQVMVDWAVASMRAFADPKLGIVGAFATQAALAMQATASLAQIEKAKYHAGGIVDGAPDERSANLLTGEAVVTRAGVESLGGASAINAINSGGAGAQKIVVVNQYKHHTLDLQIQDQLRSESALNSAMTNAAFGPYAGYMASNARAGQR